MDPDEDIDILTLTLEQINDSENYIIGQTAIQLGHILTYENKTTKHGKLKERYTCACGHKGKWRKKPWKTTRDWDDHETNIFWTEIIKLAGLTPEQVIVMEGLEDTWASTLGELITTVKEITT